MARKAVYKRLAVVVNDIRQTNRTGIQPSKLDTTTRIKLAALDEMYMKGLITEQERDDEKLLVSYT